MNRPDHLARGVGRSLVLVVTAVLVTGAAADDNWPQWRGPAQDGVSRSARDLPVAWSGTENVAWKTALPSWSGSTPIIWGDRIFVMSPSAAPETPEAASEEQDRRRGGGRWGGGPQDPGGPKLLLMAISKNDGSILWQHELDEGNELFRKGNNASPSPVTDGTHVWAVTGTGAVVALDMDGKLAWKHNLQKEYGTFGLMWGYASSPLLHDGKLIIEVLHGFKTDDPSYVVAFDALTGAVAWRTERPTDAPMESPDAYTTPVLLRHGNTAQIVISGGDYVTGHDPADGRELWRVAGLNPRAARNYRIVASPLIVDGFIYAPTRVRPLLALRIGDDGRPAEDAAWKWDASGAPDVPTPADGTYFYMVNDAGMVTCLDAKTGEAHWGPERTVAGTVSSSPLLADGKLYFTNEEGVTVVLAAGAEFKVLATNELDGTYTLSSPVASGKQLFIRTSSHLYCIEKQAKE
jgi:outer membrane protein assembly factor BamB